MHAIRWCIVQRANAGDELGLMARFCIFFCMPVAATIRPPTGSFLRAHDSLKSHERLRTLRNLLENGISICRFQGKLDLALLHPLPSVPFSKQGFLRITAFLLLARIAFSPSWSLGRWTFSLAGFYAPRHGWTFCSGPRERNPFFMDPGVVAWAWR